jgi:hypothetical protein
MNRAKRAARNRYLQQSFVAGEIGAITKDGVTRFTGVSKSRDIKFLADLYAGVGGRDPGAYERRRMLWYGR